MDFANKIPDMAYTIDRIAIQDVISAVSMHSDSKEYSEVYQYYTDDAIMEYGSLLGDEGLPVHEQRRKIMEFFPGFDVTHHQSTNFQITVDGDQATSRAQVRATHVIDKDFWIVAGTYLHKLRRTAQGWKIYRHRFDLGYIEGIDLVERARERTATKGAAKAA